MAKFVIPRQRSADRCEAHQELLGRTDPPSRPELARICHVHRPVQGDGKRDLYSHCGVRSGNREGYERCVRLDLLRACLQARFKLNPNAKEFEINAVIVCGAPSQHPNGGTFDCKYTGAVAIDLDGSKTLESVYDEQYCGQTADDVRSRAFGKVVIFSRLLCSDEYVEKMAGRPVTTDASTV